MSHNESGVLSKYNSLLDKNLNGYFSNTKMRKHLIKSGLISKEGRITGENSYRMKMAKKEHRDNVRDLLASAIVNKALDMERMRQYEIRKRLEELYKIELVQKVRSERGKRINDDLVALLTPQKKKSSKLRKTKSAAVTKAEKQDMKFPKIHFNERTKKLYYENTDSISGKNSASPSIAKHRQLVSAGDKKILHPHPPSGKSKTKKKRKIHRGLMLAKSDQMVAHRMQLQSMAEVTMKYLGCPLNLTNDIFPSNKLSEIQIIQQHCGASTICVFRELLPANTAFTFVSRRHRGSPFGLTIYINGIQNIRVSSCCEYKHKPGYKVGGKNSQFGLIAVQGAAPCYKCQIRLNLIDDDKDAENDEAHSSSDEEAAVKSYDIIVSRAGRHSDSKLSRPVSASVMTQTPEPTEFVDYGDDKEEVKVEETYEYADEDFEEDEQFALNQPEGSSDDDASSSSSSSDSELDDKMDPEDKHTDTVSKSSDSDSDDEEKQDEENESDIEHHVSDNANISSETEKSAENEGSSENEKIKESEESNENEKSESSDSTLEKENIDNDGTNTEKDLSYDSDHESASSVSSKSSAGSSSDSDTPKEDKDDNKIKHDSDKDEHDNDVKNDFDENTDSVHDEEEENAKDVEDKTKDSEADIIHEDDDSDTEVVDTSDAESPSNTNNIEEEIKEISEDDGDSKIQIEEEEHENKSSNEEDEEEKDDNVDVDDTDNIVEESEETNDESDKNAIVEKTSSVISRESTMLTGNEDGRCDSANKTIQFNEEVDVVHYAKGELTSAEEETPRSDDSEEAEFDTVPIAGGNIILANLDDDKEDVDVDLENFENETENIIAHSVEDWAEKVQVYSDEEEVLSPDENNESHIVAE